MTDSIAFSEPPNCLDFVGKLIEENERGVVARPLSKFVCGEDGYLSIYVLDGDGKEKHIGGVGSQGSAEVQGDVGQQYLHISGPFAPTFILWL